MIGLQLLTFVLLASLPTADLDRLKTYDNFWGRLQGQKWGNTADPELEKALKEIQKSFGGRASEIANHFLKHVDPAVSNDSIFLVLTVVGDVEAALILIRAMNHPPKVESGAEIRKGVYLERYVGEIEMAIEATLTNDGVRKDPRVVSALVETVAGARTPHGENGNGSRAIRLLGLCQNPHAIEALEEFASDPEASIRAAATEALGKAGTSSTPGEKPKRSTIGTLVQTLQQDSDRQTRLQTVRSLATLGDSEGIKTLRNTVIEEKDPMVVDEIVKALEEVKSPIEDPKTCYDIMGRCWEAGACGRLFQRWQVSASREEVIKSALEGPPPTKALAINFLTAASERSEYQSLFLPHVAPPIPPPVLPNGSLAKIQIVPRPSAPTRPQQPTPLFEPAMRQPLLTSAVAALSNDVTSFPKRGNEISYITALMLMDGLWELAERKMDVALKAADQIKLSHGRYTGAGRYGVSHHLHLKDKVAYVTYRKPRQLAYGFSLALPILPLLLFRRSRRSSALFVTSILLWGIWTLSTKSIREFPPYPLSFLTTSLIAFTSCGVVTAILALLPENPFTSRLLRRIARVPLAVMGSGATAFFVCAWSRSRGYFPIGSEGWDLIFEPLGSSILAGAGALLLVSGETMWKRLSGYFKEKGVQNSRL